MAHQTIQSNATIGIFNAIASQTIPQALPLMPTIVPGIGVSQQPRGANDEILLLDDAGSAPRLTTRRGPRHTVAARDMVFPRMDQRTLDWGTDRT